MSGPATPQDPNEQPRSAMGWGAPARAQGWGSPQPAPVYGTSPWAVIAGIPLLLWGLAWALLGTIALMLGGTTEVVRALGPLGGASALWPYLLVVVVGLLHIAAGAFVWAHRAWARYLGLVLAAVGALFGLYLLVSSLVPSDVNRPLAVELSLILLVPYAIALVGLILGGAHFRRAP